MAFGIDDGLSAAAAAISLTSTVVEVVKKYRKHPDVSIELLIEQVRVEAIARINSADTALAEFEGMLKAKGIDPSKDLDEIIRKTPFWHPFEQRKLKHIRDEIQSLSNSVYDASDDISALVRCKDQTKEFGEAVVETIPQKHKFLTEILNAKSLKQKIEILRGELRRQKDVLK
jgi:hypothetical protein